VGCIVRRPGNVRGSSGFVVWPETDTENITWVGVATCAAHIGLPGYNDLMGRGLTVELIKRIGGSRPCTCMFWMLFLMQSSRPGNSGPGA
jgi:hypothetical protein